ncbi:MAG TPA: protein phosphatase 2C domain-containing protein [Marmoricola sp.]|jgi:protein phosphatase|nr:protein phosphatase 2C domain-containing protein [Marmoricola sp.]
MTMSLRFAAVSDVGRVRRDNQDSGYAGPNLIVVADGVGGAARGDIASSACVDVIRKLDVPAGNDALSELAATIHLAHDRLAEIVEAHHDLDGTSTTVTAVIFDGTDLRIGHVGDSRGYLLRDGVLDQITTDHTLVQSLVDEGRITEEEARVHPHRNLILRAVDGVHEPEPDLFSLPLQVGDRLLLCSDGCSGVLTDDRLATLMAGEDLQVVASTLVHASLEAGSSDNVTVLIAEVVDAEPDGAAPITVGAAVAAPHLQISSDATGNLTDADVDTLSRETEYDPEAIRYAPQPPPRGTWVRRLLALVVILALLVGAGFGAYKYSQTRYYLRADRHGAVSIYRGVDISVPLVTLHHFAASTGYSLDDVSDEYAAKIRDVASFSSLADARQYVTQAHCDKIAPKSTSAAQIAENGLLLHRLGLQLVTLSLAPVGALPPATITMWAGPIDPVALACGAIR